jgi:hypothetical protein
VLTLHSYTAEEKIIINNLIFLLLKEVMNSLKNY